MMSYVPGEAMSDTQPALLSAQVGQVHKFQELGPPGED